MLHNCHWLFDNIHLPSHGCSDAVRNLSCLITCTQYTAEGRQPGNTEDDESGNDEHDDKHDDQQDATKVPRVGLLMLYLYSVHLNEQFHTEYVDS